MAELAEAGLSDEQAGDLKWFGIPVGARRLSDAAYWLGQIGLARASAIADGQARLLGSLQYPIATGDLILVAKLLRELAPTYQQLSQALAAG